MFCLNWAPLGYEILLFALHTLSVPTVPTIGNPRGLNFFNLLIVATTNVLGPAVVSIAHALKLCDLIFHA